VAAAPPAAALLALRPAAEEGEEALIDIGMDLIDERKPEKEREPPFSSTPIVGVLERERERQRNK
jgi:hypothetical protein